MRVAFIQNEGGNYGGVSQVNKTVCEHLIKDGYDAQIICIRDNHQNIQLSFDEKLKVITINKKDLWQTYHVEDFKECLKKGKLFKLVSEVLHRIRNDFRLIKDAHKLNKYLEEYNPDYIITSHYQVLDMLKKSFLSRTFHEQHTSFRISWELKATKEALLKYNGKVKYIWLCQNTKEEAEKHGLVNNYSIYNAVRFETKDKADVNRNKKLVTITRLSKEKRIDKMIDMIEKIFEDKKYQEWSLEIWGDGEEDNYLKSLVKSNQIKFMGRTTDPKKVLLSSSINLNTSEYEGFSLSILEASECGVPTVSFHFGESVTEQILDSQTGFIASDKEDFMKKVQLLMSDPSLLQQMSLNAKEYNNNFKIDKIIKDWEKILK